MSESERIWLIDAGVSEFSMGGPEYDIYDLLDILADEIAMREGEG